MKQLIFNKFNDNVIVLSIIYVTLEREAITYDAYDITKGLKNISVTLVLISYYRYVLSSNEI